MDFTKLKNLFLKVMIGCLIAAGMLAVVTVLTGSFNDIFARSLLTILLIALHALISFGYIDVSQKNKSVTDLSFFHNTTFILIIFSFITSIFGVWEVIPVDLVVKLYATYFVLLFAVLHGEMLYKLTESDKTIKNIVYANFIFMVAVVMMIMPIIYSPDASLLSDEYYRILAACGIIDAILTLVAIILSKLYLQKHPRVESALFVTAPGVGATGQAVQVAQPAKPRRGLSILVIILIGFLGLQLIGGLVVAVIGSQAAKNAKNIENNTSTTTTTTTPTTSTTTPTTGTSSTYYNSNSSSSYSYESKFKYNGVHYSCTATIAGTWHRDDTGFSFTPYDVSELARFCTASTPSSAR